MKRLITCAALVLVIGGAIVSTVVRMSPQLLANDRDFTPLRRSIVSAQVSQDAAAAAAPNPLRQQLLERLKAKVELMSDEELRNALEAADAELRVMQAEARLREATSILEEVSSEFEGTPPANRAKRMLEAAKSPKTI